MGLWSLSAVVVAASTVSCALGTLIPSLPAYEPSSAFPMYYHTTNSIYELVNRLATSGSCPHMRISFISKAPVIPLITLSKGTGPKRRAFFLFGEHARELISPETSLRLVEDLCGIHEETRLLAEALLAYFDFKLVPVANPLGRMRVEQGDFCRRTNENDVDLNRNWPDHFEAGDPNGNPDTYAGPKALSEPETRALVAAVTAWPPHVFITVHSGTLGMYSPFAYSTDLPANVDAMLDVLGRSNQMYCKCPMGAAGKQVGYLCPGTCLDYVYDRLGAQYAYAVEIYSEDRKEVQARWAELQRTSGIANAVRAAALLEAQASTSKSASASAALRGSDRQQATVAWDGATALLETHHSCMLEARSHTSEGMVAGMDDEECLRFFNPVSRELYTETTREWSKTLLTMTKLIMERNDLPIPS